MKTIELTHGNVALVDDEDYAFLNQFKWHTTTDGYAARNVKAGKGKWRLLMMHRVIMNTPKGMDTDHRDHDTMNNQKDNLRICTRSQNNINHKKRKDLCGTSKHKGITIRRDCPTACYKAVFRVNGKQFSKNFPLTPEGERAAALWYNYKAKEYCKDFAYLNTV